MVPVANSGGGDFSTEAVKKRHRTSRSARVNRRLLPLPLSASAQLTFESRAQSNVVGLGFRR